MTAKNKTSLKENFASVYNNIGAFPSIEDVANHLGKSRKTIQNYAGIMRRELKEGKKVPELVSRSGLGKVPKDAKPQALSVEELSRLRASDLDGEMSKLFTGSKYPVINPEAMVVQSSLSYRLNKFTGTRYSVESSPKTWLSETLMVEPVKNAKDKVFIFTGAQNDTPIHKPFWNNLLAYAKKRNAEVVVGPWTYETNWWTENNPASRNYDVEIREHLCFGQMQIGDKFMFAGEMNTLPTAQRPINDLTTYSEGKWAVYPHSRLQLLSVPSIHPTEQAFQIMTTGAITLPQVIPRKAGIKSINHHTIGATIVEFDEDGDLFCRQIIAAEDGSFQDLNFVVDHEEVETYGRVEIMTSADIHISKLSDTNAVTTFGFDYENRKSTNGSKSIVDSLRPKRIAVHDIHDQETGNHHNKDDVSHGMEMSVRGRTSVKDEVMRSVKFLEQLQTRCDEVVVVESNHDLALERYIREGRYREDGDNLMFGLELDMDYHKWREKMAKQLDAKAPVDKFSLLECAVRKLARAPLSGVKWVYDNDSLLINGVQVGWHGFRGVNGSRGTMTGYAKMGHKITIGDKHSPAILDRVYCAGVMQLEHGYNKGPSGWCVSHVLQYPNGTRTLITLQDGKWRG